MGRIREQQARGRVAVLLASDRYLELQLSAAAATPPTTEAVDQQASQRVAAAVPQGLATAGEAGRNRPRGRVGLPEGAPDAEWHQVRIAAKPARYAGEAVAPMLGEEAAAFARQMEKVTEILGEHHDAADAGAAIRELATSADAPASFTLGVLHAANASGLRRCGPKSATASGADG